MEFKNVIELEDGFKYVVANELKVKDKVFYQIIKVDSSSDFEIVERKEDELIFIEDEDKKKEIISLMALNSEVFD